MAAFAGDFKGAAEDLGFRFLQKAEKEILSRRSSARLRAIVAPLTSAERSPWWSEGLTIQIQRVVLHPESAAGKMRRRVLERIWASLENPDTPKENRPLLWTLIAEGHQTANRGRMDSGAKSGPLVDEMKDDLTRAFKLLGQGDHELDELRAARALWTWHRKHDHDQERRDLAEELEKLYRSNELAEEFEDLVSYDDWEGRGPRLVEKIEDLAESASFDDIRDFVIRAHIFLADRDRFTDILDVAWRLGEHASKFPVVQSFVREALDSSANNAKTDDDVKLFARVVAARWVYSARNDSSHGDAVSVIESLLDACPSDKDRAWLLHRVYGIPTKDFPDPSKDEITLLLNHKDRFLQSDMAAEFVEALGAHFSQDWQAYRKAIQEVFAAVEMTNQKITIFRALLRAVHGRIHRMTAENGVEPNIPVDLGEWLLNVFVRLPNPDDINDNDAWQLEQVVDATSSRPDIVWLVTAIQAREGLSSETATRVLPAFPRLTRYIKPLDANDHENAEVQEALHWFIERLAQRIEYGLPEYLRDLDPQGDIVPIQVAHRIDDGSRENLEEVRHLTQMGGVYPLGSQAWRAIALSVMRFSDRIDANEDDERDLFVALLPRSTGVISSTPGEVAPYYYRKLEEAKRLLDAEQEPLLTPFWSWYHNLAEQALRREEESVKEEWDE